MLYPLSYGGGSAKSYRGAHPPALDDASILVGRGGIRRLVNEKPPIFRK